MDSCQQPEGRKSPYRTFQGRSVGHQAVKLWCKRNMISNTPRSDRQATRIDASTRRLERLRLLFLVALRGGVAYGASVSWRSRRLRHVAERYSQPMVMADSWGGPHMYFCKSCLDWH